MAGIELCGITITFPNGVTALKNINLEVEDREFIVVLGPSGSGKTTLLRTIAGLEFPTEGKVLIDRHDYTGEPPFYRNGAMVFQNFPLYPNMTVYQNIVFVHPDRHHPTSWKSNRLEKIVDALELEPLLDRHPAQLSGGERQRVALARALNRQPDFFLLDEPLSNLDPLTRNSVRDAIMRVHCGAKVPFVYVTHDQAEAMSIANRVVVLRKGEIQQDSAPMDLYNRPANQYVASFIGSPQINFMPALLLEDSNGYEVLVGRNLLRLDPRRFPADTVSAYCGKEVVLGIRPEHLSRIPPPDQVPLSGCLDAVVRQIEGIGADMLCYAKAGDTVYISSGIQNRGLTPGEQIRFFVAQQDIHLFDQDTGINVLCMNGNEVAAQ